MNWVKQLGGAVELMQQNGKEVSIAEVDKLRSYVGEKKLQMGLDCY